MTDAQSTANQDPPRYPANLAEFWQRLDKRRLEPDLRRTLEERAARTSGEVHRVGDPATVTAFVETLLPGAEVPAAVIAQFLDANFDRQMGRGDERTGTLPRAELIPAGFAALDTVGGRAFHALDPAAREQLLARAEGGDLAGPDGFDSAIWFRRTRDLVMLGFASDPRGMVQMGYPGPSYQPGYLWLGWGSPDARRKRRAGYQGL
jgi:hypothetical protein